LLIGKASQFEKSGSVKTLSQANLSQHVSLDEAALNSLVRTCQDKLMQQSGNPYGQAAPSRKSV